MKHLLAITLTVLAMTGVYGQDMASFSYLHNRWGEYLLNYGHDPYILRKNHFRDTVSVQEMKEAFFKYKDMDKTLRNSPYEKLDSIKEMPYGTSALLLSPLQRHPRKEMREFRAVWRGWNGIFLDDIRDKNGVLHDDIARKLYQSREEWLNGEAVSLKEPRWYMGFFVSPIAQLLVYEKGKVVALEKCDALTPDFFTYADRSILVFDGYWDSKIQAGAKLMGVMHAAETDINLHHPERTFSVLLYDNSSKKKDNRTKCTKPYTLELLDPEEHDEDTKALFNSFKSYVEHIPAKAFKPYYTTDFRIMTGRYYRVTVNKCGWLVEDYFKID
ncbi:MAG: DUF5030 domain-containing protein [Bacteroides sp.]|nr:DUF5030 domain-containing protein [Bacteroides sp.]MCM1447830.1 DUF5030 domain-containing protein [Bacteroides sp.]